MNRGQFLRLGLAGAVAPPARIRGLTGGLPASGLPVPQTVEQAGTVLDGLVTTPNFRG